ncbi:surface-adhesin E family protein [Acinetobacter baumannii]|uniref:surface-adhesin E family protein n=1 Tax=Acinetobacter calcoaceticus/baumannii complex TaxID=909768 RepID=UPI0024B77512|nr:MULTISPECIES: surface-adhesin E family protein [Acinetobacter calcoaceticus/baumannii complex]MCZ3077674.1 hypothetical protein [Acinetobacter baumannii]MDI9723875.1 hypothetical protein [Acinetobacter baumannii]
MNMKFKILFLLTLTIFINQSIFANMKVLMHSDEKQDTHVLKNTITQVKSNIKRYWLETRYKEDVEYQNTIVYEKGQYTKELYESNCQQKTYKNLVRIVYNEDNTVQDSLTRTDKEIIVKHVVPESNGEEIQNYVCKQ